MLGLSSGKPSLPTAKSGPKRETVAEVGVVVRGCLGGTEPVGEGAGVSGYLGDGWGRNPWEAAIVGLVAQSESSMETVAGPLRLNDATSPENR